jgi:4-amino-4-deoxy-L-arabinose transferase-like glycosyltransferase
MWLIWLSTHVFGNDGALVVRLPSILLFAGTTWLIYRIGERFFSPWAGVYAVVALNLAPMLSAYIGTSAVTDGPMLFGLALGTRYLGEALFASPERIDWSAWIVTGVGFGIALLAKFTAVLVLPGALIFLLIDPRQRHWLLRPAPYVALAVTLAILSPALVWNLQHGLVTLRFQGGRAAFDGTLHPIRTLAFVVVLSIILLPAIWAGLVATVASGLRAGVADERRGLLAWLSVGPIVFFILVWLFGAKGTIGLHWAAPGYFLAFPLLGVAVEGMLPRWRWWIRWWTIGTIATVVAVLAGFVLHLTFGWMRAVVPQWERYDPLISDQAEWWELRVALVARGFDDRSRYFIVAGRWEDCAKVGVVMDDLLPIVCATANPIRHEFVEDETALFGHDAILVTRKRDGPGAALKYRASFASVETLAPVTIHSFSLRALDVSVVIGRDLQAPLPMP